MRSQQVQPLTCREMSLTNYNSAAVPFTSQSAKLPCQRPRVKQPSRGIREITCYKLHFHKGFPPLSASSDFTSPLAICQEGQCVSGFEAADIPALTQALLHCLQRRYKHECINVFRISRRLILEGAGGWRPKYFFCVQQGLLSGGRSNCLICTLEEGFRHFSLEASYCNPSPCVYPYSDGEGEAACGTTRLF